MRIFVAAVFAISLSGLARADLAKRIGGIISQPSQKSVQFSIRIVKADSGRAVYTHNANKALLPASNTKIVITAAAIEYLGADYEYKTRIGLCGNSLVVIGSGDPLLADGVNDAKYQRATGWIFEDITVKLKRKGVSTIKDIIIDTTIFDDERVHPNWPVEQLNRWYACEVSGLNFNDNCIEITTKNVNGGVSVFIEPKTDYVKITNKVTAVQKDQNAVAVSRTRDLNHIVLYGKCKKQAGPFLVAIERPAAFFGFMLAESLNKAGITLRGQLVEKAIGEDCSFEQIGEYTTPIADCLARCNKDSLGLAAESLLKTIAANANVDKKNGSWTAGRRLVSQYLSDLGIRETEFYIDDASGLSRENRLSANAITKVLHAVYKSRYWLVYRNSLAAGGVDGTIAKYFKEEKYKGRVFGKTGYIAGVKSFSGLCSTEKGDYIFSILTNSANGKTREAINDIAKAIIDDSDK